MSVGLDESLMDGGSSPWATAIPGDVLASTEPSLITTERDNPIRADGDRHICASTEPSLIATERVNRCQA